MPIGTHTLDTTHFFYLSKNNLIQKPKYGANKLSMKYTQV